MSKDLNRLLVDPRKEQHLARGVLARFYRRILWDLDIKPTEMNKLVLQFLDDPRNGIPNNGKARSTERGNLIKELTRTEMTWKVFIKHLKLLRPTKLTLVIHAEWRSGLKSEHAIGLSSNEPEPYEGDN